MTEWIENDEGLPGRVPMLEVATASDPNVESCTLAGVAHDYRPHTGTQSGRTHTWWRCVWCHGVSCGDYYDDDPCWEPYHHSGVHRSRAGVIWPKGSHRPSTTNQQENA